MSDGESGAGWYADPAGGAALRYWDGGAWTARLADAGRVWIDPAWTAAASPDRCPCCRTRTDGGDCPGCGLAQGDPRLEGLRRIDRQLAGVSARAAALKVEESGLLAERRRSVAGLAPALGAPPDVAPAAGRTPARAEWRPERVRDVVLWLGTALTGMAAVIFVGVAWSRLDQGGRAGLLAGLTVVTAAVASLVRRRLPATAEALGGLALALVLVDWFAAERAGVARGHSAEAWWAWGTALDLGLAGLAARWLRAARVAAVVAGLACGVLGVASIAAAPWALAVGLCGLAGAGAATSCVLLRTTVWRQPALLLGVAAAGLDVAGVATLIRGTPIHSVGDACGPAVALAVASAAPAVWRTLLGDAAREAADGLVGVASAALLGSVVVLLSGWFSGPRLVAAGALVAATAVLLSRLVPAPVRVGLSAVGGLGVGLAGLAMAKPVGTAVLGPWSWARNPWSTTGSVSGITHLGPHAAPLPGARPAAVTFAAWGLAAVAAGVPRRGLARLRAEWEVGLGLLAVGAEAALLPVVTGLPIAGVVVTQLCVAAAALAVALVFDRRGRLNPLAPALLAGSAALTAGGWALASRGVTLVALAAVSVCGVVATGLARRPGLRLVLGALGAASGLAEIGAASAAAGWGDGAIGLAVAAGSGAALNVAVWARRNAPEQRAVERIACAGLVAASLVAVAEPTWRAVVLTSAVPALAVAGAARWRRAYLWVGAVDAILATWAWLGAQHVSLLEAYTLPAAGAALAAGLLVRRGGDSRPGSWQAYGPGLIVAAGPSLLAVLARGGLARPVLLTAGALAAVYAGAARRIRAPLAVGGAVLVALALNTIVPAGSRLPRWSTIGAAGVLLLWLGATTERRLEELHRLRAAYDHLS